MEKNEFELMRPGSSDAMPVAGKWRRALLLVPHATHKVALMALQASRTLLRMVPRVRAIDADKEVALKKIEADMERDRLKAGLVREIAGHQHDVAQLILNKYPPTYQGAEYIKALGLAISLPPDTAAPQSTDPPARS